MSEGQDNAGVRVPPPLIYLGVLLLAFGLDRLTLQSTLALPQALRLGGAALLLIGGAGLLVAAAGLFRRAGTRLEPWKPTTAIVSDGIYRFSRNPMYLGMALLYAGLALLLDSALALLALVLVLVVIDRAVIAREERYLTARFGEGYTAYRARVRRWL